MICNLVSAYHKVMKEKTPIFDFHNPPTDPIELAKNIADTMIGRSGLGLAAPQIGLPYRVCAILTNPVLVMFNPSIIDMSLEKIDLEEGCLSFPQLFLKISRPRTIRVRYALPNGDVNTSKFADLTARVVQHEIDHLDGIVFTSYATSLQLDKARKDQKIRLRRMKNANTREDVSTLESIGEDGYPGHQEGDEVEISEQ